MRKQRKALVEQPCGTMQRGWDHGYFLMRGLEKVRTECSVTVLAYNLRRVLHLIAMPQLLAALGGVVSLRWVAGWAASATVVLCEKGRFRDSRPLPAQGQPFSSGF